MAQETRMHVIVMIGVIRMVRAYHSAVEAGEPFSIVDAYRIGTEGVTDDQAEIFISEFTRDGVVSLSFEDVLRVVGGDFAMLWDMTNRFLKEFGHEPIEPVALSV